jgi:hypothetical protein
MFTTTHTLPIHQVFLAASASCSTNSGLRINDMIVAVNGKSVGGLTETALEMELETGGTELILLVSRYKKAERVARRVHDAEQRHLSSFDQGINDENLLHWADLGASSPVSRSQGSNNHQPDVSARELEATSRSARSHDESGTTSEAGDDAPSQSQEDTHSQNQEDEHSTCSLNEEESPSGRPSVSVRRVSCDMSSLRLSQEEDTSVCLVDQTALEGSPSSYGSRLPESQDAFLSDEDSMDQRPCERFRNGESNDCCHEHDDSSSTQSAVFCQSPTHERVRKTCSSNNDKTGTEADEKEWEDDANAWCGCVCGETHDDEEEEDVFWVQCEGCQSWFNVFRGCIGFDGEEAKIVENWVCWGCEEAGSHRSQEFGTTSPPSDTSEDLPLEFLEAGLRTSPRKTSRPLRDHDGDSPREKLVTNDPDSDIQSDEDDVVYRVGSLVYILEHGWSGVNNPEGAAWIKKSYKDDDADQVYDVKYIVGHKSKGVLAKFIRPHSH